MGSPFFAAAAESSTAGAGAVPFDGGGFSIPNTRGTIKVRKDPRRSWKLEGLPVIRAGLRDPEDGGAAQNETGKQQHGDDEFEGHGFSFQ